MNIDVLLGIAATFPSEILAERLKEDAQAYLLDPSEEHTLSLTASAHIWMMHRMSGGTPEGVAEMLKSAEDAQGKLKLFETPEN